MSRDFPSTEEMPSTMVEGGSQSQYRLGQTQLGFSLPQNKVAYAIPSLIASQRDPARFNLAVAELLRVILEYAKSALGDWVTFDTLLGSFNFSQVFQPDSQNVSVTALVRARPINGTAGDIVSAGHVRITGSLDPATLQMRWQVGVITAAEPGTVVTAAVTSTASQASPSPVLRNIQLD